jgi:hypothetical protein
MTAIRRRKRILFGVAAVIVIASAIAWQKLRLTELSHIGAGYAAEQTCSCVFVSGRTLESCVNDLEPLARRVISVRVGNGEVTGRALFVAAATARYEEAFGCSLRD